MDYLDISKSIICNLLYTIIKEDRGIEEIKNEEKRRNIRGT